MGQELDLYIDTPLPVGAVDALVKRCPADGPDGWYARGLQLIEAVDLRGRSSLSSDSHRDRFGFVPTVMVWSQLRREIDPEPDGGLPGMNTFLAIAGRLLATVPGDAAMVQNSDYVFLYRRAGVVTLQRDWPTDKNRDSLAIPHRLAEFPYEGGPEALVVVDAL